MAYTVVGVKTTLPFAFFVMNNKFFIDGQYDTHFVEKHFTDPSVLDYCCEEEAKIATLLANHLQTKIISVNNFDTKTENISKWKKSRS